MARASLKKVAKEWVKEGNKSINMAKNRDIENERNKKITERTVTTVYISNEVRKLLMYNKADTRETMSEAIERLVLKNLKKT